MKKTYIAPLSEVVNVKGGKLMDEAWVGGSGNHETIPIGDGDTPRKDNNDDGVLDGGGASAKPFGKSFTSARLWEDD